MPCVDPMSKLCPELFQRVSTARIAPATPKAAALPFDLLQLSRIQQAPPEAAAYRRRIGKNRCQPADMGRSPASAGRGFQV